jgi:dTDP-4-dehydrorhamnose 3,5-epimerase-like enzyme
VNVCRINFKNITTGNGFLSAIEGGKNIPFDIKRVYYITGVPEGIDRGFHSHYCLHQVLICLNGSVTVKVESDVKEAFVLDNPSTGLYIGPMVWREMTEFSKQSVLLVLASDYYSEADYIRDYDTFRKAADDFY